MAFTISWLAYENIKCFRHSIPSDVILSVGMSLSVVIADECEVGLACARERKPHGGAGAWMPVFSLLILMYTSV